MAALTRQPRRARLGVSVVTGARWLDPEGQILLLGCKDGTVAAWRTDVETQSAEAALERIHTFDLECTHFSVDSRRQWLVASSEGGGPGAEDGRVCLWRATGVQAAEGGFNGAYEVQGEFPTHPYVWCTALVRDDHGRLLVATAGGHRDVHLWDATSGRLRGRLTGHGDTIRSADAIGDHLLVTSSDDGTVRIWDVPAREELCVVFRDGSAKQRTAVRGSTIAVCDGSRMRVFDLDEMNKVIEQNRPFEEERRRRLDELVDR